MQKLVMETDMEAACLAGDYDGIKAINVPGTMAELTVLREAAEVDRAKKAELRRLIQHAPVAMALLDSCGNILILNEAGYDLLGYDCGALLGKNLFRLTDSPMLREVEKEVRERLQGGFEAYKTRKSYKKPNGDTIHCTITISLAFGERAGETGFIVQLIDISEQERLAELRNEFISLVSHELRTPITSIYGSVGLLAGTLSGKLSAVEASLFNIAQRNCARLKQLVDDLLTLQYIHSGCFHLNLAKLDAAEIAREAVNEAEAAASDAGVRLQCDLYGEVSVVMVDPDRLKQVISNFLSNAVKFSPRNAEVKVEIRSVDGACRVCVIDNGCGITPDYARRIFTPFSQQAEHSTRQHEGSGLGLVISKALVETMGGTVGFESTPDVRTCFWAEFPSWADA